MKKLYFLSFFFLILSSLSFSQNYQTIQYGVEQYFADSTGYIKAIRIASVGFNGADSVYTNFFTLRDTANNNDACLWVNGPSWIGKEVIVRNDGFNIFFNSNNDSIFINTLANLNDSWRFYSFPNGNYIEAKLTSIDTGTVVTTIDSIKTISLQVKDSLGNNIADPINGRQIKFSKNHGFVQLPVFYDFPSASNLDYKRVNAHRLTWGEVYDFDVNDRFYFIFNNFTHSTQYEPPYYGITKILAKHFSLNNDTIIYQIENILYNHNLSYVSIENFNLKYTNLNNLFFNYGMPEETMIDSFQNYHSYLMSFDDCGKIIQSITNLFPGFDQNVGCFRYGMGVPPFYSYGQGLGEIKSTWYDDYYLISGSTEICGYVKNGITCGVNLIDNIQEISPSPLSLYPNPASTLLYLHHPLPTSLATVQLLDCFGRTIEELKIPSGETTSSLDVQHLASGIYFLKICEAERVSFQKVVIQH